MPSLSANHPARGRKKDPKHYPVVPVCFVCKKTFDTYAELSRHRGKEHSDKEKAGK